MTVVNMQWKRIPEVQVGGEQPLHKHEPEQYYFIIEGSGLMFSEDEEQQVFEGDAIYIPSNAVHVAESQERHVAVKE